MPAFGIDGATPCNALKAAGATVRQMNALHAAQAG
jgi:hypothetical protein